LQTAVVRKKQVLGSKKVRLPQRLLNLIFGDFLLPAQVLETLKFMRCEEVRTMTNKSLSMPIAVKPYLHQQQAFDFACMRFGLLPSDFRSNGVALLMEMGTGKTITSIGISGILYQFGRVNRILVVAPLSILGVWEEEFEKFAAFPYTLTILKGGRQPWKTHRSLKWLIV
jgi:SNF2 family DNA or RNA helicase